METLLLAALASIVGGFLTALVGFAFGLIVMPSLLLLGFPLPAAVFFTLTIGGVTRIPDLWRWRHLIVGPRLRVLLIGSTLGAIGGLVLSETAPEWGLRYLAGGATLLGVAAQLVRPRKVLPTPRVTLGFGALGGLLGPTTGLSGIPPSLMYLRAGEAAHTTIAELSGYFVASNAIMLFAMTALNGGPPIDAVSTGVLVTAGFVGTGVGVLVSPYVSQKLFRRLTLIAAAVSGVACIALA